MYNKKIIFTIILLILIMGCKKKVIPEQYYLTLKIQPNQRVDYVIEINNTEVRNGVLETSWNEIQLKNHAGTYEIYYWNEKSYVHKIEFDNYPRQKNKTISKQIYIDKPKGNISVKLSDNLVWDAKQDLTLIFNATGVIKKASYCIYRTVGIISAEIDDVSECKTFWKNSTDHGDLPKGTYYCDGVLNDCSEVNGVICQNEHRIFPEVEADDCFFLAKDLINEDIKIPISTHTMHYFDDSDHIKVYVFDMDLSKKSRIQSKEWGFTLGEVIHEGKLR